MPDSSPNRYQDIFFHDPSFPLSIEEDRVSYIDHSNRNSQIFHEALEIKYFYEGSATLMVDTSVIVAQPGDIVLINPYEFHSTIKLDENKGKYRLFMVGLDLFTSVNPAGLDLRRLLVGQGVKFNHLIRGNQFLRCLLDQVMEENRERKEHYELACRALLTTLFLNLLRNESSQAIGEIPEERVRRYALIEPSLHHIHTGYHTHITIDDLAEYCSVSKFHFCRLFKLATGLTAMQYLMNYRLKIARALLETTDKSCYEISRLCGFADESYFGRAYKKQYGCPPHRHRAILSEK